MEPKKEITVVHTTHPLSQQLFQRLATPRNVIKSNRSTAQVACTNCSTTLVKLMTCQRCKSVWYCSKVCQTTDWARHKQTCTLAERSKGVLKLVETLVANITLFLMLEVCAILDLDLLNRDNSKIGFDFPFMVRVDIGIEPSNVLNFINLCIDNPVDSKLEGMIQVNHFHSHIPGKSGFAPLTPKRMDMWRTARAKANTDGASGHPLGLLEFVNDSEHSITLPFRLDSGARHLAKKAEPFTTFSALTGKAEKPMSVASCMEFINLHIRADKQNQLKLRTEMTEADKDTVKGVSDRANTREAVVFLREKMRRETLYANMPLPE
ncbi:hypothetical protein HYDPIDRAFT_190441 [Hydnomerulius pinastri MD-312]|uniref:Unplaced genomic scaffold scaffold_49, whole genome shotgun sequence n=1 Tax=Hydnomerulius pinastri MD-312 TaxID=994086 RepID=A0A0C9W909_9AGAM|nr:hypothetical protein HYDPIDRAFT_190441 [Hydnomerulius pinastri MD-312]